MEVTSGNRSYDDALEFLYGRVNYERSVSMPYRPATLKLLRMRDLLRRLGDPHLRLPVVHVAGTKGKGSTAAMVAAVMTAAGYRTGLYTSPHLHRLEERWTIDGQPCSADELVALTARIRPVVEQMDAELAAGGRRDGGPTYFETTTAAAMLHFVQQNVDVAVLEVGLGGRLDSTNVCQPIVSVITSISLDHTKQLGSTLGSIAAEKAGIIKPRVPVVSGVVPSQPRQVIQAIARQRDAELFQRGTDFDGHYQSLPLIDCRRLDVRRNNCETAVVHGAMDYRQLSGPEPRLRLEGLQIALLGRHQVANASVAIATLDVLRRRSWNIPELAIRQGLAAVRLPARVEIVAGQPTVVLDAAHNAASLEALVQTLDESLTCRRRVLVFATTQGKDARGMLRLVLPRFDNIIFTRYLNNPRVLQPRKLAEIAEQLRAEIGGAASVARCRVIADPGEAWRTALDEAGPQDLVCVTGSFFIAAEIRELINQPSDVMAR